MLKKKSTVSWFLSELKIWLEINFFGCIISTDIENVVNIACIYVFE